MEYPVVMVSLVNIEYVTMVWFFQLGMVWLYLLEMVWVQQLMMAIMWCNNYVNHESFDDIKKNLLDNECHHQKGGECESCRF